MFGKIKFEFRREKGLSENSRVWKDTLRIPMFRRKSKQFKGLKG